MQKLSYFLIILIFFISRNNIFSQQNETNKNGYNKFYFPEGQISAEGMMQDGKPNGLWITYFPNGKIKSKGLRTNFKLDSIWLFYDDEGHLKERISFKNDKKNGNYERYKFVKGAINKNIMISNELFLDGLKQGLSYQYYDNGKLHYKFYYKDNRKHGEAFEYDTIGNIISELRYRHDVIISKNRINRYDNNGKKSGTWKIFHPSGKLKILSFYKNGKLEGYVKEYDEKGKLLSSNRYIEGELFVDVDSTDVKTTVKKAYYSNGKLKQSGAFKHDKPVGLHNTYSQLGEITSTKKYSSTSWLVYEGLVNKNGKKQGDWTYFYKSGKIKSKGSYKNGRRVGAWKFYYENGKIEQVGQYDKKGKATSLWIWYYRNGKKLREEQFVKGKPDGKFTEYDAFGNILVSGSYTLGSKTGKWYYNIGDEIQEGSYKNNRKEGLWKILFASDKSLKSEGKYIEGNEHGKFKYYYPTGKLKMEGDFSMGKRHKTWYFYNEDGVLRISISYKFDEEVKIDGVKITDKN